MDFKRLEKVTVGTIFISEPVNVDIEKVKSIIEIGDKIKIIAKEYRLFFGESNMKIFEKDAKEIIKQCSLKNIKDNIFIKV